MIHVLTINKVLFFKVKLAPLIRVFFVKCNISILIFIEFNNRNMLYFIGIITIRCNRCPPTSIAISILYWITICIRCNIVKVSLMTLTILVFISCCNMRTINAVSVAFPLTELDI